jgi:hypothetical protein
VLSIDGLPTDRALAVEGARVADAEWSDRWDHVVVRVSDDVIAESEEIGEVVVDFARLLLADEGNSAQWVHSDAIDGRADFVFWGRDAEALAEAIGAPALDDGGNYGWKDLPIEEAVEKGTAAEDLKDEREWKLATDFRPHSHHWALLEQVRGSPTESGVLEVGAARVCLFMTSWGDGVFPVFLDKAADGSVVQVRVQLWEEGD